MEMRIEGISGRGFVIVQIKNSRTNNWQQDKLTFRQFEKLMQSSFLKHYKYYETAKDNEEREINENGLEGFDYPASDCASWFYNFGETREMRRKGEAFIFTE